MMADLQPTTQPLEFSEDDIKYGANFPTTDVRDKLRKTKRGRLAGHQRDKQTQAQMKAEIASLWRDGESYPVIAEVISDRYNLEGPERITGNAVHYHVKRMLQYWRQQGLARMDERQAMCLARLDQIESLAVEAYFASMEGKRTTQYNKQIERARSKEREQQILEAEKKSREGDKIRVRNSPSDNQAWGPNKAAKMAETGELEDLMVVTQEKINRNVRLEENQAGDPKYLAIMFNCNRERAKIFGLYQQVNALNPDQESAKLSEEDRMQRVATLLSNARERRQASANMLATPAPMGGWKDGERPVEIEVPEVEDDGWGFTPDEINVPQEVEIQWD